mmetsp:Transcript_23609/g.60074  ORF Transcript_23609/g.60074 Transcript_23609/m.60074 type:complete len:274 (+) Transcript_23609:183-1004(+)
MPSLNVPRLRPRALRLRVVSESWPCGARPEGGVEVCSTWWRSSSSAVVEESALAGTVCTRMLVRTVWSSSSSAWRCTHASVFSSCMYGMSEEGSTSSTSSTVASMLIRCSSVSTRSRSRVRSVPVSVIRCRRSAQRFHTRCLRSRCAMSSSSPPSCLIHQTSIEPACSSSLVGKSPTLWQQSRAFRRRVACWTTDMNSGTKRAGFAFHHHGQPMRIVLGESGPRPAHWMACERPSETSRASTVMQKPCTPIVFMRRDMSVFSASLFCTATSSL